MSDDEQFSTMMSSLDVPMIVVTTGNETDGNAERGGCLVGFHSQSSIGPGRYCVWLSKANHTTRVAQRSTHLAVHFLTGEDLALAERFGTLTGDQVDKFAGLRTEVGPGGVPVLLDVAHRLVVRRTSLLDEGGDHLCIVTEPVSIHGDGPFGPLRLSDVEHLTPGHEAEERHTPPTERAAG